MTSLYGIISVSDLESDGTDYSQINSKYTDSVIEEWISMAEQYICTKLKTTFDSGASNEIKFVIKAIARQIAINKLISDQINGYKDQQQTDPYSLDIVVSVIRNYTPNLTFSFGFASHEDIPIRERGDGN